MNARDDLFTIVQNALASTAEWESGPGRAADAIIAAGWVPADHVREAEALAANVDYYHAERDALAATVERVRALCDDLWRVAPCGCGHRADLHVMGRGTGCTGGLTLCKCTWSFDRIVAERIRAALAAPDRTATREEERDG